jgi:hypothetical protein
MTWKKANEAYFGDSFNRDSTTCSYAIAGSNELTSLNGYVDMITTCADNIAYGKADKATSGDLYCSGVVKASDFAIECATDSLSTALKKMQAQIDELKLNMVPKTGTHKLRSALATLKYEREIK